MLTISPPPAYPADMSLTALRTAELLLTTTLRLFAANWREPMGRYPAWQDGFEAAGIADCATAAFNSLFSIVTAAPRRNLDVRCACCPVLGFDEGRLLQLVCLIQRDRRKDAAGILGDWLLPAASRMALLPARGLAFALAREGLTVPLRRRESHAATTHWPAHAGSRLVH